MPLFRCEAVGSGGDGQTHTVEAANVDEASRLFRAQGLFVTKIVAMKDGQGARPASDPRPRLRAATGTPAGPSPDDEPSAGSGVLCRLYGEQLVLYLPPSSAGYRGPFPFIAISSVVFLAVVTLFAIVGGLQAGDAPFIVPILSGLWLVGLGLLYIYVRGRFGGTYILVEPGRLVRRFDMFGWQRSREYPLDGDSCASLVADFRLGYSDSTGTGTGGDAVYHVHVITTCGPAKFGSYLSDDEKKWIAARINRHLGRPD